MRGTKMEKNNSKKREHLIVSTTGTSLLSNGINYVDNLTNGAEKNENYQFLNQLISASKEKHPEGRVNINTMNYIESLPAAQKSENTKASIKQALLPYINVAGGKRASAEINTLESMFEKYRELRPDTSLIIFLYSDTFISEICAEILHAYFTDRGFKVTLERIVGLTYDPDQFVYEGINSLIEKVITIITNNKRTSIKLAITGGFKAEFAYITLIGSLYDIELYYKHEIQKKLLRLPPISIRINLEFYLQYLELFKLVEQSNNYDLILKKFPEVETDMRLKFLIEKRGGSFFFTPSGKIVNEILRAQGIKIFISHTSEKEQLVKKVSEDLLKMENNIYIPITYKEKFYLLQNDSGASFREICHDNIENCSRFILILGTKIGSKVDQNKGTTYIEDEFKYACKKKKNILIFVPKDILQYKEIYKELKSKFKLPKDNLQKIESLNADIKIFDLLLEAEKKEKFCIEYENEKDIIKGIKNKWEIDKY